MKLLFLLFTAVPILEMALLIQIGQWLGALPTIGLVVLTAVIGVHLLRQQGWATVRAIQTKAASGEVAARELIEGAVLLVGGALLLTPGFVTDVFGFACLLPFSRRAIASFLIRRGVIRVMDAQSGGSVHWTSAGRPGSSRGREDSGVIEGDFQRKESGRSKRSGDFDA